MVFDQMKADLNVSLQSIVRREQTLSWINTWFEKSSISPEGHILINNYKLV